MQALVLGATGVVGGYITHHLAAAGARPLALSRRPHDTQPDVTWIAGDLEHPERFEVPPADVIFSTAHPALVCKSFAKLKSPRLKRIVQFTSSSIDTKLESGADSERANLKLLAEGEAALTELCEQAGVTWTVLRPTLIYAEGRDVNVTRISHLVRRLGFIPLAGRGLGLRQPVHAEDLAHGAIAAAQSEAAANRRYILPGTETLSYREMVGRVFDGMGRRRRVIPTPPILWRIGFALLGSRMPGANAAMGTRMSKDMIFDATPAVRDFGWTSRAFRPDFQSLPRRDATS